ncbi:MAG: M48 family metallopeptidase [Chloroflexi bacterium]|nr:M48 family metallopeptidase [Chloroflexota bacterium]
MDIHITRSKRRKKTVSARLVNGVLEVQAPAHATDAELAPIIEQLRGKLEHKLERERQKADRSLMERAQELNRRYFNGKLRWTAIRYVSNQNKRFGSCTPDRGTIRLSNRLEQVPDWVRDYVIVHELAHLQEPNHSARFWQLVRRYPKTERAIGFLMALGYEDEDADQSNAT